MLGFVWVFLCPSMVIYHNNKGKKLSHFPFLISIFDTNESACSSR
ncbi:hypothetical protein HPHPH29_0479 [Helicobacter pylori Hp H-29]|nr:hypothetical protein HPHPH29_0479 [Helicobacter pylori Hp H-29]EJB68414.1 hypothetical protein HPHPA6_1201 [Helicobacter pylori Hp A-6]EJB96988.1 hypothetical protein HPHPH34_0716 [Helicobacter pylori Hp H-34]